MFGSDGKRYIDLGSGIAVNIFGHCDPVWTAAVEKQLHTFAHTSNYYYSAPQADLAERLCTRTGMARVFFSNSGAEANECAIKTARKYAFDKYGKGRSTIVTLTGSFHGRGPRWPPPGRMRSTTTSSPFPRGLLTRRQTMPKR